MYQEQELLSSVIADLIAWGFGGLFTGLRPEEVTFESLARDPALIGVTWGGEAEAFVSRMVGGAKVPVCVSELFLEHGGKKSEIILPGGKGVIEASDNHGELVADHTPDPAELCRRFDRMAAWWGERGLMLDFCDRRPDYGSDYPPKVAVMGPRYHGLIEAILLTKGERGKEIFVRELTTSSALHLHVGGLSKRAAVRLFNLATRLSVFFEAVLGPRFGTAPHRNARVWGNPGDPSTQWAPADYLPDLREFPSYAAMLRELGNIPQFLDSRSRPSFQRRGLTKTLMKCIWFLVRPSRHGTMELRFNSSLPSTGRRIALVLVMLLVRAAVLGLEVRDVSLEEWRAAM